MDLPSDLVAKCEAGRNKLFADLDRKLESEKDEDYETYFLMASKHPTIPARTGYYLGYLVAKEINKTLSLETMVSLKGQQLLNRIRSAMKALEKQTTN